MRRKFKVLLEQAGGFERMPVGGMADRILFQDYTLEFFSEAIAIEQIAHADSAARHFVLICGTDTARRGADFRRAASLLGGFVHFAVIRKNHVGTIAEKQSTAHFDAGFFQVFEFRNQCRRINHGAGTDHGFFFRSKYAAGNQLEDVAMAVEDDGMPCIVPARVPSDVVKRGSHIVYDLALAFIAPLRADYYHCLSRRLIHQSAHPEPFQAAQSPVEVVREALQEGCCSKERKPSYAALGVKARVVRVPGLEATVCG